ncbi:helix-turn-helix domain-containing protein, partial [Endozoicomonas atrinae]|uniref:helix-turn-helix domain-containing protein n=1 Tax=Endozoicomonas atrinae TaxID=1333660 RepID=UPI001112EE75
MVMMPKHSWRQLKDLENAIGIKLLEEEFQTECDLRTVYKLLHRVKLSWISGRSKHPNQDLEA